MDWNIIKSRLESLPDTYRRSGSMFQAWESSFTESLALPAGAIDNLVSMLAFKNATGKWLDLWGQIFGIQRQVNEIDSAYAMRISATLTAWRGTVPAIIKFILQTLNQTVGVIENLPAVGYQISMPASVGDLNQVALNQKYVRPAGVPYTFSVLRGGLFLGTLNYVGKGKVSGSYLTRPVTTVWPNISRATPNSVPAVPTTFLSDPTINS